MKETTLQEQIKAGDIKAYEILFKTYYMQMYLFARKYVDDEEVAKDIIQETFLNHWEKRSQINIQASLKSYLFRSVYNNCMNYIKHEKVKDKYRETIHFMLMETNERPLNFTGIDDMVSKEMVDEIKKAIDSIPDTYKPTFKLSRSLHLKNNEIAEMLNIPIRTVETHLYRSLKHLKQKLSKHIS